MDWASRVVAVLTIYAIVGLVFAVAFAYRGAARLDPAARQAPLGFRLLIVPGVAALWPLLAWRWLTGSPLPVESNAHRRAAGRAP